MAEEAVPWGDEFDDFLKSLDDDIQGKYGMSLRDFLLNPGKYASVSGSAEKLSKIKGYVDNYFENTKESLRDENERFEGELKRVDSQYSKMDEAISTKTALARIPYITPVDINSEGVTNEEVVIGDYNNAIDALLVKLVNVSTYVSNISRDYKNYKIGRWLFSGQKNYTVTINLQSSPIVLIDNLSDQMGVAFDAAMDRFNAAAPVKK
jgi:hypothetical protein